MQVVYSLLILKEELDELKREMSILQAVDAKKSAQRITQLKHQIGDLKFSIEVLESYLDE